MSTLYTCTLSHFGNSPFDPPYQHFIPIPHASSYRSQSVLIKCLLPSSEQLCNFPTPLAHAAACVTKQQPWPFVHPSVCSCFASPLSFPNATTVNIHHAHHLTPPLVHPHHAQVCQGHYLSEYTLLSALCSHLQDNFPTLW